jgi:lipopolysaccharide transport system permease protein
VTVIAPPRSFARFSLREIFDYRDLLQGLALRRFKAQFEGQYLGFFWAVARPLIMMAVFAAFRRLSSAQVGVEIPYFLYVYSGLILWFSFTEAVLDASQAVRSDIGIIKKVYFPTIISPLSAIVANFLVFSVSFAPLAVMMIAYGTAPGLTIMMLPFVLLQLGVLTLGLGCLFAALALSSRDWERFLTFALYVGLFVSPVIFAPSILPESVRAYFYLNPMAGTLQAFRASLFGGLGFPWAAWAYSCAFTLLTAAVGLLAFQHVERNFSERL